jgi:RING-box protein 1
MSKQSSKEFKVKKWNAVITWEWDTKNNICSICRNSIMIDCIRCQTMKNVSKCNPVWGKCEHIFHKHCIDRWLLTRYTCPLDDTKWEYQKHVN